MNKRKIKKLDNDIRAMLGEITEDVHLISARLAEEAGEVLDDRLREDWVGNMFYGLRTIQEAVNNVQIKLREVL